MYLMFEYLRNWIRIKIKNNDSAITRTIHHHHKIIYYYLLFLIHNAISKIFRLILSYFYHFPILISFSVVIYILQCN